MLLEQLSTHILLLSCLCLVLPARVASRLFSFLLVLLLYCICVVPIASGCRQRDKWPWMAVKAAILLGNLRVHQRRLFFGVAPFLLGTLAAGAYVASVNLLVVYGCPVMRGQLALTLAAGTAAYAALWFGMR